MAKGSARQRKKIAKKISLKMVQSIKPKKEEHIAPKTIKPKQLFDEQVSTKPAISTSKQSEQDNKPKRINTKKLSRKKRKKLKLQELKKQRKAFRGKSQEQYYKENPSKQYSNEADDMTEEYATNIINDLEQLPNTYQKDILLDIFYRNYRAKGNAYIQSLHDTGTDLNIHDTVEVAIMQYKGFLPDKVFSSMINWLNAGVPLDARNMGVDDDYEDISSEVYE